MKYSISESARIVGITRKTLYKHIDKKPISTEKDNNGKPVIDASELIRVYGDQCKFNITDVNKDTEKGTQKSSNVSTSDSIEMAVTKKELELLKSQMASEKDSLEEQIDYLRKKLDESTSESRKLTALITDQSQDNKADDWQKSLKMLEQRISNQEESAKVEQDKAEKENKILRNKLEKEKEALAEEQGKGFWKRLLG